MISGQVCLVLVHWSFGSVAEELVTGARAGAPPEWPAVGSGRCWPDTWGQPGGSWLVLLLFLSQLTNKNLGQGSEALTFSS